MSESYTPTLPPEPSEPSSGDGRARRLYLAGERLLDRYLIHASDARGAFGVVYFVTDQVDGRRYAVKTFKPEFAAQAPAIGEFIDEISFWVRLAPHPHIVTAHFVELIDEQPYLFIEYVPGEKVSLRDRMASQALPLELVIRYAYMFILGMEFANRTGEVAHLDLKPENLLIAPGEVLKITDFGLAQPVRVLRGQIPVLSSGSWAYAPPERLERFATRPNPIPMVDPKGVPAEDSRSDIFAFGLIFYEMATGRLPFPLDRLEVSRHKEKLADYYLEIRHHGLDRDAPVDRDILAGCLALDTSERFRNFRHLRRSFEAVYGLQIAGLQDAAAGAQRDEGQEPINLYNTAHTLSRIGRYREALEYYNLLLVREPAHEGALVGAAQALVASGQEFSARVMLRQVLESYPHLAAVGALLAELDSQAG